MPKVLLHTFLAFLILAQPVVSASAWAAMQAGSTAAASPFTSDPLPERRGCHDPEPVAPGMSHDTDTSVTVADCCDDMNGVTCGMDCGAASSAFSHSSEPATIGGHGAYVSAVSYAAPSSAPAGLYKPPRIS